jgi:hypothetical protein
MDRSNGNGPDNLGALVNRCTGQAQFAGEQDDDPANDPDESPDPRLRATDADAAGGGAGGMIRRHPFG